MRRRNSASARDDRLLGAARDDLGQLEQLHQGLALGDALRAERHVDRLARLAQAPLDDRGDPGIHGAAEDEDLAVAEMVEHLLDRPQDEPRVRVEVLVDRRAHDDHDVLGRRHHGRVVARLEPARGQDFLQQRVGTGLEERHLRGAYPVDRARVAVVEHHRTPGVGQGEPEREPDVAAPAHDHDVLGEAGHGPFPGE